MCFIDSISKKKLRMISKKIHYRHVYEIGRHCQSQFRQLDFPVITNPYGFSDPEGFRARPLEKRAFA